MPEFRSWCEGVRVVPRMEVWCSHPMSEYLRRLPWDVRGGSGRSSWTRAMMSSAPLHPQPFLPWAPQGAGISLLGDEGGQVCKEAVYWEVPHALC